MQVPRPFTSRLLPALAFLAGVLPAAGDIVKPLMFGPFFMNQLNMIGSPAGYDYVLTNGTYHFQVGWIEPLAQGSEGIFGQTYFETNANLNVSPFTSDLGTTFNLKPLRYLELGLSYNRLMYHSSMIGFAEPEGRLPAKEKYRPRSLMSREKEIGGADIFRYQANVTLDWGRAQFYLFASRTLWDIDAKGKDYVYEYRDAMLLATRDRVNNFMAQFAWDMRPHSLFRSVSFTGLALRNQYWFADQTRRDLNQKNLVSAGITGFRMGRNSRFQRRGLDFSVGYWTLHDQIPDGDFAKSLVLLADWQWNIHVLKI